MADILVPHSFYLFRKRKRLEFAVGETLCEPLLSLLEVDDAPNDMQVLCLYLKTRQSIDQSIKAHLTQTNK